MQASHPSYRTLQRIDEGLSKLRDYPTLLAWGNQDFVFTPAFHQEWKRRFPKARSLCIDSAGHLLLEDAPDEVIPAVASFLNESRA